jgi:hypothetical protein
VVVIGVRPDAIVARLLENQDPHVSARDWRNLVSDQPAREAKPSVAPRPVPIVKESRNPNPFKRRAKKLPVENADTPTAVEQEVIAQPVEPPPVPRVESIAPVVSEPEPEPAPAPVVELPSVPVAEKIESAPPPSGRDLAEQEIVDLILRAQRVAKSTGAPLDVCLEELRRHLSTAPVVAEAAPKRNRRIEFQTSKDGLLTGAKVIEE